jgi:DNA polymerase-3 subunit alpha
MLDSAMARAAAAQRDKRNGQVGLFGDVQEQHHSDTFAPDELVGDTEDFPREELLAMERDLLGLYVSDHPLNHVREALERSISVTSDEIQELGDAQECVIGGLITELKYHTTKKSGERMAFLKIEDLTGPIAVTIFPSVFKQSAGMLEKDKIIVVKGKASHRERLVNSKSDNDEEKSYQVEIVAESVSELKDATPANGTVRVIIPEIDVPPPLDLGEVQAIHIRLAPDLRPYLPDLKDLIDEHPGDLPVVIHVPDNSGYAKVCTGCSASNSPQLLTAVSDLVGATGVWTE